MLLVCFWIAAGFAVCTLACMAVARRKKRPVSGILLAGLLIVEFTLMLALNSVNCDPPETLLSSFIFSLKSMGGADFDKVVYPGSGEPWIADAYRVILYGCFFLMPIITASFLMSLLDKFTQRLRLLLIRKDDLHVFSELNEKSLSLGAGVRQKKRNARLIYCDVKGDHPLMNAAKGLRAVRLPDSLCSLPLRFKRVTLYAIKEDEAQNSNDGLRLIQRYSASVKPASLYVFSSPGFSETLFDAIPRGNLQLRIVDETKYVCYAMLDRYPLYEAAAGGKLTALIAGDGRITGTFLKAILWAGQLPDCRLTVHAAGPDAEGSRQALQAEAPGLTSGAYDVQFHSVDLLGPSFQTLLRGALGEASYIVVCAGDDEGNIAVAQRIRLQMLRNDLKGEPVKRRIFVYIQSREKTDAFLAYTEASGQRDVMIPFGSVENVYSYAHLANNAMEKTALLVNRAYYGALGGERAQTDPADKAFFSREYNQRSSFASALHMRYKIHALCGDTDALPGEETARRVENALAEPGQLEQISVCEHARWNAFLYSEGYETADRDTFMKYTSFLQKTVYHPARLHPCLVPWEALPGVDRMVEERFPELHPDYRQTDRMIVEAIPEILTELSQMD